MTLYRYLDTDGDGTGTTSAVGDYASAAEEFKYTATETTDLHRMIVYVEDAGAFDSTKYGNDIVLTNGITVKVLNPSGGTHVDLTAGKPILTNTHWARLCYDVTSHDFGNSVNKALAVRWTFSKSGLPLQIPKGYSFVVTLNDAFDDLIDHTFHVQGVI